MSHTITVRLTQDLADWLDKTARKTGVPQGRVIREQLERARLAEKGGFMRLAGAVSGPPNLSTRIRIYRRNRREIIPLLIPPSMK